MSRASTLVMATFVALALAACDAGPTDEERGVAAAPPAEVGEEGLDAEQAQEARALVEDATSVVDRMQSDPDLANMLRQARGVFIVPAYGKAAAVVGARGGEGVLLARGDQGWSGPLFYDIGAISVGAQAGAAGGDIAMLLMSERALESFREENNFSLNADAGLTIVDYSARAQASVGKGDVVLWSDMEGAFAGVALSVTDISWDEEENAAYYQQQTTPQDVLTGKVESQYADALRRKLQG